MIKAPKIKVPLVSDSGVPIMVSPERTSCHYRITCHHGNKSADGVKALIRLIMMLDSSELNQL